MQWSQLKTRIEATFADSVKGRLEVWSTRYRHAVHQYGEAWITIDKVKVATMGTLRWEIAYWRTATRLQEERHCTDYCDPAQSAGYQEAHHDACRRLQDDAIFASWDLNKALFAYLNLGIEAALASENPLIRAFAMLDRRCGKRRLETLDMKDEHPLVSQFYQFRCAADQAVSLARRPRSGPSTD